MNKAFDKFLMRHNAQTNPELKQSQLKQKSKVLFNEKTCKCSPQTYGKSLVSLRILCNEFIKFFTGFVVSGKVEIARHRQS